MQLRTNQRPRKGTDFLVKCTEKKKRAHKGEGCSWFPDRKVFCARQEAYRPPAILPPMSLNQSKIEIEGFYQFQSHEEAFSFLSRIIGWPWWCTHLQEHSENTYAAKKSIFDNQRRNKPRGSKDRSIQDSKKCGRQSRW